MEMVSDQNMATTVTADDADVLWLKCDWKKAGLWEYVYAMCMYWAVLERAKHDGYKAN